MANRLSMATSHSVESRHRSGPGMALLSGIDRWTINAYVRRLKAAAGDPRASLAEANPPTGSVQNRSERRPQVHRQTVSAEMETGSNAVGMPPGNGGISKLPVPSSGPLH